MRELAKLEMVDLVTLDESVVIPELFDAADRVRLCESEPTVKSLLDEVDPKRLRERASRPRIGRRDETCVGVGGAERESCRGM